MKHKLFGKLALSAALLGTATVPVHASGADTSDVPKQPGKSAPIQAATTISILPNPLELAERYAPETVQDWKETLEKYGKLAGAEEPSSSRRLRLSMETTVMHIRLREMANSELQLP